MYCCCVSAAHAQHDNEVTLFVWVQILLHLARPPPLWFPLPHHPLLEVSVLVYFCPLTSLLFRVTIAPRRSGLCGGSNGWAHFLFIYSSSVLCAPSQRPLPNATCVRPCFCVSGSQSSYAIAGPQRTLSLVPALHPLSTRHGTDPIIHAACQLHCHLTQGVSLHKCKRPPSQHCQRNRAQQCCLVVLSARVSEGTAGEATVVGALHLPEDLYLRTLV